MSIIGFILVTSVISHGTKNTSSMSPMYSESRDAAERGGMPPLGILKSHLCQMGYHSKNTYISLFCPKLISKWISKWISHMQLAAKNQSPLEIEIPKLKNRLGGP